MFINAKKNNDIQSFPNINDSHGAGEEKICDFEWQRLGYRQTNLSVNTKTFTLVDLFCGCGGMSLGVLEALKFNNFNLVINLAIDNNVNAINTYKKNFGVPDDVAINSDISELLPGEFGQELTQTEKELRVKYNDTDFLVAGPPCQGNSNLNNHTRGIDPRNKLYLKVIRFAEITLPKVVIIENVASVVHDKNEVVFKGESALKKLGYEVEKFIVYAQKIGIPQTRKRHILIAVKSSCCKFSDIYDYYTQATTTLGDCIEDLVDEYQTKDDIFCTPSTMSRDNQRRVKYLFDNDLYDLPNSERPACHKYKKHKYGAVYGRLYWNKPAPTITGGFGSMGQGRFVHPLRPRVITAHEAARIQGFPDFFDFSAIPSRSSLYEIIGNAVPPKMTALPVNFILKAECI